MIPALDALGRQLENGRGEPLFVATEADKALRPYDDAFVVWLGGRRMAVWDYIERFERVKGEDGRVAPFRLNEAQILIYREMAAMKMAGKPVRVNYGKARQVGGSTLIAGMFWALTAFRPGVECGIVADTEDHGVGLLEKYRLFYETTPDFLRAKLKACEAVNNSKELSFRFGDGSVSRLSVVVQGENAGRSRHFNLVHESEVALWDDIEETLAALDATVSYWDADSIIVRETTAKGANGWKALYDQSAAGKGSYRPIFVPWHSKASYRMPYDGHQLNEYELNLRDKLGLSLDQIQFWRSTWENYGEDYVKMASEFPTDAVEMFRASGTSLFNAQLVADRKSELIGSKPLRRGYFTYERRHSEDGLRIDITGIRWRDDPNGAVSIHEEPIPGHPYVMNNDPAMGGKDWWATLMVDNSNCRQCATFHQCGCDADEATFQCYCLYRLYEDAGGRVMACGETNTTAYFVNTLRRCGVRDIYVDRDTEGMYESNGAQAQCYGYKTKTTNRTRMIEDFVVAFREESGRIVNDYDTICEIEAFQVVPSRADPYKGKAQATGGAHDDLVMAYAGFFLVRGAWPCSVERAAKPREGLPFDPLERKRESIGRVYQIW